MVDIGSQSIKVSCVEDGVSLKASRVRLAYGSDQLATAFAWMLQRRSSPLAARIALPDGGLLRATGRGDIHSFRVSVDQYRIFRTLCQIRESCQTLELVRAPLPPSLRETPFPGWLKGILH